MAQRDYVKNRGSTKKKRRSSSTVSTLMIVLVAAILLVFMAILYFVAHNNKPIKQPIKPQTEAPSQSVLPARPEERWSYIKELENRDVMSEKDFESEKKLTTEQREILKTMQADRQVRQQPVQTKDNWSIQCGSFKSMEGADSIKAQLALAGHESKTLTSNGWYRVVLGPYQQKNQANIIINDLKAAGISSCILLASGG